MLSKNKFLCLAVIIAMVFSLFPANILLVHADALMVTSGGNSGEGTLRAAVTSAQSGAVITFDPSVITVTLDSVISTNKELTIRGAMDAPVTISGGNANHLLFDLTASGSVTMENLIFTGVNGTMAVQGSTGTILTINSCRFENNVTGNAAALSFGKTSYINDTVFINNVSNAASTNGAATQLTNNNTVNTVFSRCLFKNNQAGRGAAINQSTGIGNANVPYYVRDCAFIGNKSLNGGTGGSTIYMNRGWMYIVNSTFFGNTEESTDSNAQKLFSSLNNIDIRFSLIHCTVINNPGGINVLGSYVRAFNSIITGNGAVEQVQRNKAAEAATDIAGTNLTQDAANTTNTVNNIFGKVSLSESDLVNGRWLVPSTTASVISLLSGSIIEQPTNLDSMLANDQSGAPRPKFGMVSYGSIHNLTTATRTVTVGTDNLSSPPAGSLRAVLGSASDGDTITFDASVTQVSLLGEIAISSNLNIIGNGGTVIDAQQNGRIFNITAAAGKTVYLKGLTIKNGNATGNGGAILAPNANLAVENVRFENNKASGDGGSIYGGDLTQTTVASFIALSSRFTGNSATNGGALYLQGKSGTNRLNTNYSTKLNGCCFDNNLSSGSGKFGSVIYTANTNIRATNSTFYGNKNANGSTWALYQATYDFYISLVQCTFVNNDKGIYTSNNSRMVLVNSILVGNGDGSYSGNNGQLYLPLSQEDGRSIIQGIIWPSNTGNTYVQVFGSNGFQSDIGIITPLSDGLAIAGGFPVVTTTDESMSSDIPSLVKKDQLGNSRTATSKNYVSAGAVAVAVPEGGTKTVTNSADSGAGSLRDTIFKANPNDTITFAPDVTLITLSSPILMSKDITISGSLDAKGEPLTTISGGGTSGIFDISKSNNITARTININSLKLINGSAVYGGAIGKNLYTEATRGTHNLNTADDWFLNNNASKEGGAIWYATQWNTGIFNRCLFKGNTAPNGGACAFGTQSKPAIVNSSFIGNTATAPAVTDKGGSAILFGCGGSMANTLVYGNIGTGNSQYGAVAAGICSGARSVVIFQSAIVNNTSPAGVAAVTADTTQYTPPKTWALTVANSIILGNGDGSLSNQYAGYTGTVTITDSLIQGTTGTTYNYQSVFGTNKPDVFGRLYPLATGDAKGANNLNGNNYGYDGNGYNETYDRTDQAGVTKPTANGTVYRGPLQPAEAALFSDAAKGVFAIDQIDGNTLYITRTIHNNGTAAQNYTVLAALYAADGSLTSVRIAPEVVGLAAGSWADVPVIFDISEKTVGSTVSVFVIDNFTDIRPLAVKAELPYTK